MGGLPGAAPVNDAPASRSSTLRPLTTLLSGSTIALAVSALAQPLLTRLYAPGDFGVLDTFVAAVALVGPVASLRYEDAVPLPAEGRDALQVAMLAMGCTLAVSFVAAFVLLGAGPHLLDPWHPAYLLIPIGILGLQLMRGLQIWHAREEHYRTLSTARILQAVVQLGLRVLAAVAVGAAAAGLIGGYLAGLLAASLPLLMQASSREQFSLPSLHRLRRLARRYRRFALFGSLSQTVHAAARYAPIFLLLHLAGPAVVGQYGRAALLIAVPLGTLGSALSQIYLGRTARRPAGTRRRNTHALYGAMLFAGFYPAALLAIWGPEATRLIFGADWALAGEILRWLALWLLLTGVASPLTILFDLAERQRTDLTTSLLHLLLPLAGALIGHPMGGTIGLVAGLALGGALARAVQIGVLLRIGQVAARGALTTTAAAVAAAVPGIVTTLFLLGRDAPVAALVATTAGALLYAASAWLIWRRMRAAT